MQAPAPGRSGLLVLTRIALFAAVVAALAVLAAGPAYRFRGWPLLVAIDMIRWGATAALVSAAVATVAAALAFRSSAASARTDLRVALVALAIGLCVALPPSAMYMKAQRLPHIHDISTDREQPPAFVSVLPLRTNASNSTDYKPETARLQQSGYPDIAPRVLKLPPAEAFARAERAARAMDWEIVAVVPADYRIEATATSLLFGFKDDIVIRVRVQGEDSRVDVRSLSRVGGSDFGVNAERIRAYLKKLDSA